jgi:hypothetical protein
MRRSNSMYDSTAISSCMSINDRTIAMCDVVTVRSLLRQQALMLSCVLYRV